MQRESERGLAGQSQSLTYDDRGGSAYSGSNHRAVETAIDFFFRQKWLVLLCTLLVVVLGALYAFLREPIYATSSLVDVELEQVRNASTDPEVPTLEDEPFATNDRSLVAEVFLLQTSNSLRARVSERLRALDMPLEGRRSLPEGSRVSFDIADQAASAIVITASSPDPEQAAILANLFAEEYVLLTDVALRTRLAEESAWLEERETQRREDLLRIEAGQQATGGGVDVGESGPVIAMQINNLEAQRDQARIELQVNRASLQTAQGELDTLTPDMAGQVSSDDTRLLEENQRLLSSLLAEKDQTERRYPDSVGRDPLVVQRLQRLDTRIQQLRFMSTQLSERIVAAGRNTGGAQGTDVLLRAANLRREIQGFGATIAAHETQIGRIDDRLAQQYARLQRLPGVSSQQARRQIQQAQSERARLNAERSYQEVADDLEQARITEEASTGYARIIRAAGQPTEPVGVPFSRLLSLSLFLGLSLGFGLAFVREKLNNRLLTADQLRALGYPVLATIPDMTLTIKEGHGGKSFEEVEDGRTLSTSLYLHFNPYSPASEAYRHLRTNVLEFPGDHPPLKLLIVTSPAARDGKSTTAANLAIAMAQSGRRTLLIDADLRRPTLHQLFGLSRSPGVFQHLNTGARVSMPTGIDNLDVIPAGEVVSAGDGAASNARPGELLSSAAVEEYFQNLREFYDIIIVDTPPVLATSDALQLSKYCDALIVTVRANETREGEIRYALDALEQVDAPIIGTVLNGFKVAMAFGHKYRYRSYTEYGLYPEYGREVSGKRKWLRKRANRTRNGRSMTVTSKEDVNTQ